MFLNLLNLARLAMRGVARERRPLHSVTSLKPLYLLQKIATWVCLFVFLLSLIAALTACDLSGQGKGAAKDIAITPSAIKDSNELVKGSLPTLEKIYFDTGKYETPDDTSRKVSKILEYAKLHGNSRLAITGFHDTVQESEAVLRLARQRGMAVRSVLISAGISEDRVVMLSAQESKNSVGERQATRVEVSVSP